MVTIVNDKYLEIAKRLDCKDSQHKKACMIMYSLASFNLFMYIHIYQNTVIISCMGFIF